MQRHAFGTYIPNLYLLAWSDEEQLSVRFRIEFKSSEDGADEDEI